MIESGVTCYPINADKLEKGDTIPQSVIADFIGVPVNSKAYELGVLSMATKISKCLDRVNRPCTVVVTRRTDPIGAGGIRVLTDEEALAHNGRGFKSGLRRSFRRHKKTLEIDPSKLTSEARQRFERTIIVQGQILASVASTRAKAVLKACERQAPKMIQETTE